jgi:5'-nucleotidase
MRLRDRALALALLAGFTFSCSHLPPEEEGDAISRSANHQTLVILGTNDLHGALAPITFKSQEAPGVEPVTYQKGGLAILADQISILREKYGPNLIWLDAGDEFQGSIESNMSEGEPMVKFFNAAGVDAAAIGNHEFDFGQDALRARIAEADYPFVDSNLIDRATGRRPEWKNTLPHLLLTAGKLKVGVIGLTTRDTPVQTRASNVANLEFTDLREATLREAKALRDEGAEVVVATAHVGIDCDPGRLPVTHRLRQESDPQGRCHAKDEMTELLKALPHGTLDAVVAGHSHKIVHHWVNGVPVIQGGSRGHDYNLIYLTYDWKEHHLVPELSRIEGPIPVCPKVFENQNDCDGERAAPPKGRGSLVTPRFRGQDVQPDPKLLAVFQPYFERSAAERKRVIAHAARKLEHLRTEESPLGDVVADAIRTRMHADVGLMNSGGVRASIEQGPITFEDLFRALPFDNYVSLLTVTGKQLKDLLQVAESGSRGYFPVSGVRLEVLDPSVDAKAKDLDGDGKLELWEIDRLRKAQLADGSPIRDDAEYRVATIDFLVTGGDDMAWPMKQIPASKIQLTAGPLLRDAVEQYLTQMGTLNTVDHPVPSEPRIHFVKPSKKRRVRRHSRHHRR